MPRHTKTSDRFEMMVPKGELADWRVEAARLSVSVAELIRIRMGQGRGRPAASMPPLINLGEPSAPRVAHQAQPAPVVVKTGTHEQSGAGSVGLGQSYAAPRVAQSLAREVEPRFKGGKRR